MNKIFKLTAIEPNVTEVVFELESEELPKTYLVNLPLNKVVGRPPYSLAIKMLKAGCDCQPLVDFLYPTVVRDSSYYLESSFSTVIAMANKGREIINNFDGGSTKDIAEVLLMVKPIVEVYNVLVEEFEALNLFKHN